MTQIKAVLFDNDGTLVDTHDIILASMRYATREVLRQELDDDYLMSLVGTPLDSQMVYFAGGDEELGAQLARVYRAHNDIEHDRSIKPFAGVPEMLEGLRARGILCGVVTAKLEKMCRRGLRLCGIEDYMQVVVCPDNFPKAKPDPAPVLHGCELLGVRPDECIYIGDSPYDMRAGVGAGCLTVGALWGMFPEDALAACGPDSMIGQPGDLLGICDGR